MSSGREPDKRRREDWRRDWRNLSWSAGDFAIGDERLAQYQQEFQQAGRWLALAMTAPVIWLGLVPAVLMDLFVSLYQWCCFPVYGIEPVRRRDYLRFERERLRFLGWRERLNCAYCTYFNGVVAYTREVAARTERYWCPLKHRRLPPQPHRYYDGFAHYGDEGGFRRRQDAD